MERISGRTVLITGGASGIGLAIAQAMVVEGARVVLADIDQPRAAAEAARLGDQALAVGLDVTDRDGWAAAKRAAENRFGPVDILVNNAGIGYDGSELADMDPASFDRVIRINLTGVFNGISAFAAEMRDRGEGHIVNTASTAALTPSAKVGAYAASKSAVFGLSEALRAEMKPHGVGVTVLFPGLIRTRLGETTLASGSARVLVDAVKGAVGLDPEVVGQMTLAAIRANAAYVHTHPHVRAAYQRRADRVLAAFDALT